MKPIKSSLHRLPHRELKRLARENAVPTIGHVDELATRLENALPAPMKEQAAGAFLETKRAYSYRYYRIKRGSQSIEDLSRILAQRDENKDPFRTELRPTLEESPK